MARNDMLLWAWGPDAAGSSDTPWDEESTVESRKPSRTSAWRDRAQNPCSSLRYTGASARSRAQVGYGSSWIA